MRVVRVMRVMGMMAVDRINVMAMMPTFAIRRIEIVAAASWNTKESFSCWLELGFFRDSQALDPRVFGGFQAVFIEVIFTLPRMWAMFLAFGQTEVRRWLHPWQMSA